MRERVVVGLPVEVLRLQYDAVAVEDERFERRRGTVRGRSGNDEPGRAAEARRGDVGVGSVAEEGAAATGGGGGGADGWGDEEGGGSHRCRRHRMDGLEWKVGAIGSKWVAYLALLAFVLFLNS